MENAEYCKYCGYTEFRVEKIILSNQENVGGKVGITFLGISGGLNRGDNRIVSREYESAVCTLCHSEKMEVGQFKPIQAEFCNGDIIVIHIQLLWF